MSQEKPSLELPTKVQANWYFSFGHGQKYHGHYVKLYGTSKACRVKMFERFGRDWSMQYSEAQALPMIERWKLTELQ